ncbi:putative metalloprotease CJM1_0395 family protein [Marinobacter sp.]|uniref:putative metalloprotease CJM1_0395 family protein n=1 Tax=Marinobacter sp. TaxID=50741 RepID=UPI003850675B
MIPTSLPPAGFGPAPTIVGGVRGGVGKTVLPEVEAAPDTPKPGSERRSVPDGRSVPGKPSSDSTVSPVNLDEAALKELETLKARDREVRAHEMAHKAVGGQYAGAISYVFQRGPDGAQYAVGGEVSISLSPIQGDPQATVEKMRIVRAAAMAPAEPSGQDRAVAAEAMQMMLRAQVDLALERRENQQDAGDREARGERASAVYGSVSGLTNESEDSSPSGSESGFQAVA